MLGSLRRRPDDPSDSPDPQIREVVARLRSADFAPSVRPEFRDELRAQLVAVTERIVAESAEATGTQATHSGSSKSLPSQSQQSQAARSARSTPRRRSFLRPLGIAATVTAVLALVLVGAVFLSQRALPGDSLYGLKRASEDVRVSLTHGDTAKGTAYLHQAQTRVQEAQDLLGRTSAQGSGVTAGAGPSPQTQKRISTALIASDADLAAGWNLLKAQAQKSRSAAPADLMVAWGRGQVDRLQTLKTSLPSEGAAYGSAVTSYELATGAVTTASATATLYR